MDEVESLFSAALPNLPSADSKGSHKSGHPSAPKNEKLHLVLYLFIYNICDVLILYEIISCFYLFYYFWSYRLIYGGQIIAELC